MATLEVGSRRPDGRGVVVAGAANEDIRTIDSMLLDEMLDGGLGIPAGAADGAVAPWLAPPGQAMRRSAQPDRFPPSGAVLQQPSLLVVFRELERSIPMD